MGLLDWLLRPVQTGGSDLFKAITTPPPTSSAGKVFAPPATSTPVVSQAIQSQAQQPASPPSQQEQQAVLDKGGLSMKIYRTVEDIASQIRGGIPKATEAISKIPIVGKPLAAVTPYTTESVVRMIQMGGMIPGGVETLAKKPAIIPAMIVTGAEQIVTGTVKSATEEPKQFISDIATGALLGYGIPKAVKAVPSLKDVAFGRMPKSAGEITQVIEPGRGIVETRIIKNVVPGIPELKLKDVPSQLAGTDIQTQLGGRTVVATQVAPAGAQPFRLGSFTVKEIPGSMQRQFAKEAGFYMAPEETGGIVPFSSGAVSRAETLGSIIKPSPAVAATDILGEAVLQTIREDKSIAGGSFGQKLIFKEARKPGDYDIISKNPEKTAQSIIARAASMGEEYIIKPDMNPIYGKYPKQMIFDKLGNKVAEVERTVHNVDLTTRKTVKINGIQAVAPSELFSDKLAMVRAGVENIKAAKKAAGDIEYHTGGQVSAKELLTPSLEAGTPQAYTYYAGLKSEPTFLDVLSGKAKLGSGGRPTISINPKQKIDVFPKEILEAPVTQSELTAINIDIEKLRMGQFPGIKQNVKIVGTPEQWAKTRRLTAYAKEHPGTYPGVGALGELRPEFEIYQSPGVKNILTPTTFRGKVGKYLGFGERSIKVGKDIFEVQTFKTVVEEIKTPKTSVLATEFNVAKSATTVKPSVLSSFSKISETLKGTKTIRATTTEVPEWIKLSQISESPKRLPVYKISRLASEPISEMIKSSKFVPKNISVSRVSSKISQQNITSIIEMSGRSGKKLISGQSSFKGISGKSRISPPPSEVSPTPSGESGRKSTSSPSSTVSEISGISGISKIPESFREKFSSKKFIITDIITSEKTKIFKLSQTDKGKGKKQKMPTKGTFLYGEQAAIATTRQMFGAKK